MDFQFGEEVVRLDGGVLGRLRALVYDPATQEVVSLAVDPAGPDDRQVLVPIGSVDRADESGVILELSDQQFRKLEPLVAEERNIAPPPDAANVDDGDEITEPIDVPDVPPVGAATGVESIGFTPVIQDTLNTPAAEQIIDENTEVWATDEQIAVIHDVQVDDQTRRVTGLNLDHGEIDGMVFVPADWIASIQTGTVVLNVDRATVEAQEVG